MEECLPLGEKRETIWLRGNFSKRAEKRRKMPAQRMAISIIFSKLAPKRREKAEREARERRKGENLFLNQFQSGLDWRRRIRDIKSRIKRGIPLNWGIRKGTVRRRAKRMKDRLMIFASQNLYLEVAFLLNQINYGRD
jgi:hypothetical protein